MNTTNSFVIDEAVLTKIPKLPGVYQFADINGKVIYIGKAKDLRSRISQYVNLTDSRPMVPVLMENAATVSVIITPDEEEALILESSLIRKKQPQFNIDLKDDKSYPYLAITKEEWPRLIITRQPWKKYLFIRGPFTQAALLHSLRDLLQTIYPLKYCSVNNPSGCINHQMGICPAPCRKNTDRTAYMANVTGIIEVLQGKKWKELSGIIKEKISKYSEMLNFEKAASLRDTITMIPDIQRKFGVEFSGKGVDDLFSFRVFDNMLFTVAVRYSDGELFSVRTFSSAALFDSMESCIAASLASFYRGNPPAEKVFLEPAILSTEQINSVTGISFSKTGGIPSALKKITDSNLEQAVERYIRESTRNNEALKELSAFTGYETDSIMCLDISTLSGDFTVAGAVWWEKGKFIKNKYRKYRIKTVSGVDDFGSLREVASRLMKQWLSSGTKPSLLLIDGGKGQVSSVNSVIKGIAPVAGIIKDRRRIKGMEQLITADGRELQLTDSVLSLILRSIRDETHRFAISFNRSSRKSLLSTTLKEISGIGPERELALLNRFKTVSAIRKATVDELKTVSGISESLAIKIFSHFN